eukprot:970878-Pelagomonas_calceolata.AAC.1
MEIGSGNFASALSSSKGHWLPPRPYMLAMKRNHLGGDSSRPINCMQGNKTLHMYIEFYQS